MIRQNFFYSFIFLLLIIFLILFKKSSNNSQITLGFMGDVMIGRFVNKKINEKNYEYPWGNLLPILRKNDFNLINLETTLTKGTKATRHSKAHKADPINALTLKTAEIDVANLANNHIVDFDIKGMLDTLNALDQTKIKHVGAGVNIHQAKKPVIIIKNNIKIGILGYTDLLPNWKATENKPGINYIDLKNIDNIKADINKIKKNVDILILTIHWGPGNLKEVTKDHIDFAHQAIDFGVDIIHGHSAHAFHAIEIYKNKVIFYDTGAFIDDYVVFPESKSDQSFLFLVDLDKHKIKNIKLLPVLIANKQVNLATGNDFVEIADKMKNYCARFGTKIISEKDFLKILI